MISNGLLHAIVVGWIVGGEDVGIKIVEHSEGDNLSIDCCAHINSECISCRIYIFKSFYSHVSWSLTGIVEEGKFQLETLGKLDCSTSST